VRIKDIKPGERYYIEGVRGWDRHWSYEVPDGYDIGGYATVAEDQTDAYIEAGTWTQRRKKRTGVRVIWDAIPAGTRWKDDTGRAAITVVIPPNRVVATEADHRAAVEAEKKAKEEDAQRQAAYKAQVKAEGDEQAAKCDALGIPYYQEPGSGRVRVRLTTAEIIALVEEAARCCLDQKEEVTA